MINILLESGLTEEQVAGRTGHQCSKSLQSYHAPSNFMKKQQTSAIVQALCPSNSIIKGNQSQLKLPPLQKENLYPDTSQIKKELGYGPVTKSHNRRRSLVKHEFGYGPESQILRRRPLRDSLYHNRRSSMLISKDGGRNQTPFKTLLINQQKIINQQNKLMSSLFEDIRREN